MASEKSPDEQNDQTAAIDKLSVSSSFDEGQTIELNNRIKKEFMSYCFSFLRDNEDIYECARLVWQKYLQWAGDVAMLASFFDSLPYHVKVAVLPKYHIEIMQWCQNLFHINCEALFCSTYFSETIQRVIRYAARPDQLKKGIIYIPMDFDQNIKTDLTSSLPNIRFQPIANELSHDDLIDIGQLEEYIKRDSNDPHAYPLMVVAHAGSTLLGHCDQITKLHEICEQHNIWLHAIGDLVGSLALLPMVDDDVNFHCDSVAFDFMKTFALQNLPYVTLIIRPTSQIKQVDDNKSLVKSHPLYDYILNNPSVGFLSVWAISQRCSNEIILSHMKQSADLTSSLLKSLKTIKRLRILNDEINPDTYNYSRICSGNAPKEFLPKLVVIFRFEPIDETEVENIEGSNNYVDLLNLWLFDKLCQQYPKMNLELIKSVYFQVANNDTTASKKTAAHAIRFAPLEHVLDILDLSDIQAFIDGVQRYCEILFATMTGRKNLASTISNYENILSVPMPQWAGVGAVRYIPTTIDPSVMNEASIAEINTIQAELARQLQTNDSAFSLGADTEDDDSVFYLRLGMIRKPDDLDVLLQKIITAGKETEASLKYVEDMAEKIRSGIDKVQKDLQEEDLQLLAQDGLLRQLPLISNIMSWWSPAPSTTPLAKKGRSFDLNSGRVESTETIYTYRMQIKKQSPHAPTHTENDTRSNDSDNATTSNQSNANQ